MSEMAAKRYAVFNEQNQPVELYYAQQVIIVPLRGRIELDEEVLQAPQIQHLLARRFISAQEIQVQASAEEQQQVFAEESEQGNDEEEQKPADSEADKPSQKRRRK